MVYIVDDMKKFNDASRVAEYITNNMGDEYYADMLDECYDDINICGYDYSPSIALARVDEVAYKCGRNDYYDGLSSDIVYELDRTYDGEFNFYGFDVEVIDDDLIKEDIEELKETIKAMEEDGKDASEEKKELVELEERLKEVSL